MREQLSSLPTHVIGEIGRLLASAEMLRRGLSVSRPEVDVGFDLVSTSGSKTCRIQVKTRYAGNPFRNESFAVRRRRSSAATAGKRLVYGKDEIDAFIFVSLLTDSFWVVPSSEIDLSSHKKVMTPQSQWRDAWHLLMEESDAA